MRCHQHHRVGENEASWERSLCIRLLHGERHQRIALLIIQPEEV